MDSGACSLHSKPHSEQCLIFMALMNFSSDVVRWGERIKRSVRYTDEGRIVSRNRH